MKGINFLQQNFCWSFRWDTFSKRPSYYDMLEK